MAGESGWVQSVDTSVSAAFKETLAVLPLLPEDAAVARLAERYAATLDRAAGAERAADRVLAKAQADGEDADLVELVAALRQKLSAVSTLTNIGPKLLDALNALGASPKARAATRKGGAQRGPSRLDQLRAASA